MEAGATVAGRFSLERPVGTGGMGTVFRAVDLQTRGLVALKLLNAPTEQSCARFLREASLLASVRHPAVVAHVDHGVGEDGRPYLAMQWLEGEDLGARLARGPLEADVALALVRRIGDGLGALHRHGIVHRDVKPANIMLVGSDPADARLVDLGIARGGRGPAVTRTGVIVGTVGYMALEQLEGAKDIDGRVDVFSLGCVLFECLAGAPAYQGEVAAVLARVLLEAPPRLRDALPAAPAALDELLARCMARDRRDRFADMAALCAALDEAPSTGAIRAAPAAAGVIRGGEQRPVALVLAQDPGLASADTVAPIAEDDLRAALRAVASRWGGTFHAAPYAAILVVGEGATAGDQAARAARAALDLAAHVPAWTVSVAVSTARVGDAPDLRGAIDRAAAMLTGTSAERGVFLDAATAGLLDVRFAIEETERGAVLRGLAPLRDDARPLLGKLTPCVGREKELRLLEGTLAECVEESSPRAVLLVAEAGMGKSKLRREFLSRVEEPGDALVLRARTETNGRLDAFALIRSLLQNALAQRPATSPAEPPAARWRDVRARFGPRLADGADPDAVEFFGELLGAAPATPSATLRAARADPAEMRWRLTNAVQEWLRAEAAARAVVVSLEDLHEADASSVGILAAAWPALHDRAVLLVGTARPEVEATHPALLSLHGLYVLRLLALGKKAAERLAREVLERDVPVDLAAMLERSNGHPFLLEELIRHVAAGRQLSDLPASVLATVQSRLLTLADGLRRVLRAASIYGERFPVAGVAALLGSAEREVYALLNQLVDEELIVAPRRGEDDGSMSFRHALTRDAAYAMLLDEERIAAHRAAAAWLARAAAPDASAVAEQFQRGGELERAAEWFSRASREAARSSGVQEAILLAQRARIPGVSQELQIRVLLDALLLHAMHGRIAEAMLIAEREVPWNDLAPGSEPWLAAKMAWTVGSGIINRPGAFRQHLEDMLRHARPVRATLFSQHWTYILTLLLCTVGAVREADRILALSEQAPDREQLSATEQGYIQLSRAFLDWHTDSACALDVYRRTIRRLEADAVFYLPMFRLAIILTEIGRSDEAREIAVRGRERAQRQRDHLQSSHAVLAEALSNLGHRPPRSAEPLLDELPATDDVVALTSVRVVARASAWRAREDDSSAERVARELAALAPAFARIPWLDSLATLTLAEIDVFRGQHAQALARLDALGEPVAALIFTRTGLRCARVRALRGLGRHADARAALRDAQARLERLEAELVPDDRACFADAPYVRETRALAEGEGPS